MAIENSAKSNSDNANSNENFRTRVVPDKELQVAAIFSSNQKVQEVIQIVTDNTNIEGSQIEVIEASDPDMSKKLERNSESIGKSMWTSHLLLGSVGLAVGLLTAFLLTQFGPALTKQNPLFTYIALISPGLFIGLFVAGLIGLRPDRNEVVQTVRHAVRYGKVALIINLKESQSAANLSQLLNQHSDKVVESIR
ncbi:hypothetical protein [Alteromonas sp. KUL106]|uniref:hypothetical protein n=1 Tax=Alteromonas sp. KUL106 TaxID=2480799 RepID=UPI0012E4E084|nr:hypothetical protein [Alteromonas sp. KUL106]GFD68514.1 hypothetical protein KUL106_17770 [Alteromonas sp. KUL106]